MKTSRSDAHSRHRTPSPFSRHPEPTPPGMKTLYWDSTDPLDCWDNPNCRWGDPSYRLEPGDPGYVEWFPPGYEPPKPTRDPRDKWRRLSPISPEPNQNINTEPMSDTSFHYDVGPTSGNRWRPRPVPQGTQDGDAHVAAVVARLAVANTPITPELAAAAIKASHEVMIINTRCTCITEYPGGYQRTLPVCEGSQPSPNFEGTLANLSPKPATYLTADGRALLAQDFHSVLGSINAEKCAVISRVFSAANGADDQYKIGKIQVVQGRDLAEMGDPVATSREELTGTGAFYVSVADGTITQVPWDNFSPKKPSEIEWIVPTGLTGPQTLVLKVFMNGGVRTTTWNTPLAPAP